MCRPVPPLWTSLTPALDLDPETLARVDGPRHWWPGSLDVEGLALGATQAAATALRSLVKRTFSLTSERVAASFGSLNHLRVDGRQPKGFAPLSGFHRTADGWVRLHANYPHHAEALRTGLRATDDDAVRAALADRTALAVEARVNAAGGIAAAVRTPEEWRASPMGAAAAEGPWLRFDTGGPAPSRSWRSPTDRSDAPLRGLRVLDLTRVIAGPGASRLLGALGADVLRVDPPHRPELLDQHIDTGFCKRSILLDLRTADGRVALRELLADAHLVFLGYRPGALERFGLTPPELTATWPGVKVVALNAWGEDGPWAHDRGFDSIVQAACGIAHVYRDGAGTPGSLPVQALDHATGMGMVAATAALLRSDGIVSARLSLARTAHELMSLPLVSTPGAPPRVPLRVPVRHVPESAYGTLDHVPPPLLLDARGVEFAHPPVAYGSSVAEWTSFSNPATA